MCMCPGIRLHGWQGFQRFIREFAGGLRSYAGVIPSDLRPLGAGEILDRAVTVFVRHFWLLVLILALVAIPVAILSYFSQPDITKMLTDFQKVLAIPPGHRDQAKPILDQMNASALGPVAALTYLLQLLVGPLAVTACVIAIARSYRGEPPSVGVAYRAALGRWLAQIITAIVFIAVYIGVVIAVSLATFAVIIASGIVYAFSHMGGFIVGIPLGIAVVAAYIVTALLVYL